jgi:site-specific DNA recombinase
MLRVALYARYSSDQQRAASIADQQRICREYATRQGWMEIASFTDAAVSGASLLRPGFQALMRAVVAESLDRFSRDQEDTAGLFKRLTFAGVRIVTVSEGDIGHLHVGLKGTMNALYLHELAEKTRRGLRGRVEAGKSGGGVCYGYRVVRALEGQPRGDREIHPGEASVVRRIFQDFIDGVSPRMIAKALNAEGVSGPMGVDWSPSTIHGHANRGTGILNNELYVGRLVWNRQHYMKDPDSGKRIARPNPPAAWIVADVPHLRIVDDDTWSLAKARQVATRQVAGRRPERARRPKYLFSGLTVCGACGGGYILSSHDRLTCFNARDRGTCTNSRSISRFDVESRVLRAMRERLLEPGDFAVFCEAFTAQLEVRRRAHMASLTGARRELGGVERSIQQIIRAVADGYRTESMRAELIALEARKVELTAQLAARELPALHPKMAEIFRAKVTALVAGLEDESQREVARGALRGILERIIIPPGDGLLQVRGNLDAMLLAARNTKAGAFGPGSVGNVGCGGPQPSLPTHLYVVAA